MKKARLPLFLLVVIVLSAFLYLKVAPRPLPPPRDISWDTSEKNVYAIQVDGSAKVDMGSGMGMTFDQTFLSRLALKVLSEDESGIYTVARFINPEYWVMGQSIPLKISSDSNIVVNFGRGGEVRHVFTPASFGENETGLIKQIFLAAEIHLAPDGEEWEWRSAHDQTTADYLFQISGNTLKRKTLHYENKDAESVTVLSSDFSCEISPAFWIDNVSSYEEKDMKMGFASSSGYVSLKMRRVSPMPSDIALWNETDDIKTVFSKMRQSDQVAAKRGRSVQPSPFGLETTEDTPLTPAEIALYFDKTIPTLSIEDTDGLDAFIQFLVENPEAVETMPAWLLSNGDNISDSQHSIFMFALEKCGSSEAQSSLTILASDERYGELDNARAIIALGGVAHIKDESIRFMQSMSQKNATERDRLLANTAILNLGAAAELLRASDPIAYRDLVAEIRNDLHASAGDVERSAAIIGSMGNIHDNALLPEIAPYTDSEESALRAAAYDALRFMEGDEPEGLIRKGFVSEENGEARLVLSSVLSYREPNRETAEVVMDTLKSEKDGLVINNMLSYIYKAPDEDGSVSKFLRESMKNEALPIDSRRDIINELRRRNK